MGDISELYEMDVGDDWLEVEERIQNHYDERQRIKKGQLFVLPTPNVVDGLFNVYIDGSTGWKRNSKLSGIAVVWDNRYHAIPIARTGGANGAEHEAFRLALKLVVVRPITVITDSSHVTKHSRKTEGVQCIWQKRNSCPEQKLVDTLSKLAARSGKTYTGYWDSETDKQFYKVLGHYEDVHHGNQ